MKISTFVFCIGFIGNSISASSQFIKGEKLIGGNVNVGFGNSQTENVGSVAHKNHSFGIGLSPRFGWVTASNRMMGILVGTDFQYSKSFAEGSNDYGMNNAVGFNAGYFLRNYKSFSQQAGFFIEYNMSGSYSGATTTEVYLGVESKYKSKTYNAKIQVYPGFYYRASSRVLLEASFGGLHASYTRNKGKTFKSSNFNIGASFPTNLTLGVQFFLKK